MEDFVGAKFYCPHAPADGNHCIRIREKTLEFSSTVLSTLSPYHSASISLCLIVYFIITAKAGYEKTDVFFSGTGSPWSSEIRDCYLYVINQLTDDGQ